MSLKEFKEKSLSSENSFLLKDGHGKILCVKCPIGQAEYIYAMREYLDGKGIVTDVYEKMEMVAILKNGKIYMIKPYNIMTSLKEEYPKNVFYINDDFMDDININIKKKVFDKLYDELPIATLTENEEKNCKNEARHIVVYNKDINEYIANKQINNIGKISVQKFADSLCGVLNLEEDIQKDFESKIDVWKKLKSSMERIKELVTVKTGMVLEDYEKKLVESLHDIEAKTVQIEFLYNGKIATGRIEKDKILGILANNDYFSSYIFTTMKSGEDIINKLGAGGWKGDRKEPLTCKHINKITYGRKVLYQRTEV